MKVEKAGCILINKENNKIGLIYRQKQKDYSFPKGHRESEESLIECAIRETAEETGLRCRRALPRTRRRWRRTARGSSS